METTDINSKLIENYFALLKNLSSNNKLDLIAKLSESIKSDITNKKTSFDKAYGAWDNNESAEELIATIKESRTFRRNTEEL